MVHIALRVSKKQLKSKADERYDISLHDPVSLYNVA